MLLDRIFLEPTCYLVTSNDKSNYCEAMAVDRIKVLITQETKKVYYVYQCRNIDIDHVSSLSPPAFQNEVEQSTAGLMTALRESPSRSTSPVLEHDYDCEVEYHYSTQHKGIEGRYRLRMSDWCYKICDYIKASRHIVSIAFNYVDRFLAVEKYTCDSSFDYKVTSITCLLIALKVHNHTIVKPSTLADLSQGEITTHDILVMEHMILGSLSYHLCPPITHSFISSLCAFLPSRMKGTSAGKGFVQKCFFLAELSIMDISLRTMPPSVTAFTIIMHVLDANDGGRLFMSSTDEKESFIEKVQTSLNIGCSCYNESMDSTSNNRQILVKLCNRCRFFDEDFAHEDEDSMIYNKESRDDSSPLTVKMSSELRDAS